MSTKQKASDPVVGLLQQIVANIDNGRPWLQPALRAAFLLKLRRDFIGYRVLNILTTRDAHDPQKVRICIQEGLKGFERRTGCSVR